VYELKFADAIYDFLAEILHRRHMLQHSTYQCAYKSASAGLLDLQAQVAFLTNRAAVLGAALDSLPSQIDREQEEYAESQLKLLPPELVSQARAMLKDREWARLSWKHKLARCSNYIEKNGVPTEAGKSENLELDHFRGNEARVSISHAGNVDTSLVCCATLRHAGGDHLAVCPVLETRSSQNVLLASTSEADSAVRLWLLSESRQSAEHLHTCETEKAPFVSLYSSPLLGGKVFTGGSFPADVIQMYNTDGVRDSFDLVTGIYHPPLGPVARMGKKGGHMEIHAIMAVDAFKLLSGDENGVVSKWDIETSTQELSLLEHRLGVRALARVNENTFVSGSVDTSILLWDLRAQRDSAGELQGQCDAVTKIFMLDGAESLLISAGHRTLKVWDMRMMKLLRDLDGCAPMTVLNSKKIVTAFSDSPQSLRIWSMPSFVKICDINAHQGPIKDLDACDSLLYSIATDKRLKLWHLR
jgi:hypothetical protein